MMARDPAPSVGLARDPAVDLLDQGSVDAAVTARLARRRAEQVEADIATFVGMLRDVAERRVGVTVHGDDDRRFQGIVIAVAADHVVMATRARQRVYLRLEAVHVVRVDPGVAAGVPRGDRPAAQDLLLVERLARWLDDPPHVAVYVAGRDEPIRGRLVAVGEDVVTVHGDHDRHPTWIAAAAVRCVATDL